MKRLVLLPIPLYIVLLLGLSALGTRNQDLHARHLDLLERKVATLDRLAELRAGTAAINGPHAIRTWAEAHGMVPVPEGGEVRQLAPVPAPVPARAPTGLEVLTLWR